MLSRERLTQKEKELVAIAASIASGGMPCTARHIKLAHEIGATDGEVLRSIYIAMDVRDKSTEIMAEASQGNPVYEYPIGMQPGYMEQLTDNLVSMGAALACNSVIGLEYYLTQAWAAGASIHHIQTVAGIARTIRKEAEEEADAIVRNLIEPTQIQANDQPGGFVQQVVKDLSKHITEDGVVSPERQQESDPPPCGFS